MLIPDKLNRDAIARIKTARQIFVMEFLQVDLMADQNLAQFQAIRSSNKLRAA
jgi:hypothetical protein